MPLASLAYLWASLSLVVEQNIADQRPNKRVWQLNPHYFAMTEFTSIQQ
jgi:hypothetical protein